MRIGAALLLTVMSLGLLLRKSFASLSLAFIQATGKTRFLSIFREIRNQAFLSPVSRQRYRTTLLSELFKRAEETTFLGERFEGVRVAAGNTQGDDVFGLLRMLQPIGKGELARRFPEGVLTKDRLDKRSIQNTSGTTGDRLSVVTNFPKRETARASTMYMLDIATNRSLGLALVDIPPNVCNTVCGLEGPPVTGWLELVSKGIKKKELFKPGFRSDANGLFERRVVLRQDVLAPLDARSPSDLLVQLESTWRSLDKLRPELLRAFPQYLLWISQFVLKTKIKPLGLKFAMPYGGLASGSLLEQVRESLGVQTRNAYGTSELGPLAVSCDDQTAMHVNEHLFELEIMREGQSVNDGDVGEIVVTDFTNTAMPLIRYKVGDVGRFVRGECRCGRTTRRIEVLGRLQETIQLEDRWITPASIAEIAYSDRGVGNFRVDEIGANQYELQIAASLNDRLPDVELIKKKFSELFERPIRVSHRIVPYIQPEPNGKFLTCRLRSFRRNG